MKNKGAAGTEPDHFLILFFHFAFDLRCFATCSAEALRGGEERNPIIFHFYFFIFHLIYGSFFLQYRQLYFRPAAIVTAHSAVRPHDAMARNLRIMVRAHDGAHRPGCARISRLPRDFRVRHCFPARDFGDHVFHPFAKCHSPSIPAA
jgi:hypothetical protein